VFVQIEQTVPSGSAGVWDKDGAAGAEGAASPGSHGSPNSVTRPPSLPDGSDSPIVPSWRTGPDADLVYKAGTLSLYTHDTGTWESAFFELAQWSGDGRVCLRYKRFRGDERWRQCWRLSSSTEIRRGAQRSTLSMRERMSDACPSGVVTMTALEPRDKGGLPGPAGSQEDLLDELLIGTRYELTIDEWADRIGELLPQASASNNDAANEKRPASPPTVPLAAESDAYRSSGMAKLPNSSTPALAAVRNTDGAVTVEDLSLVSPTSLMSPVRPYSGAYFSSAVSAPPVVPPPAPASAPSPPVPALLPPAPPGMDDSDFAMRSGVAARRRAMGGGLNPEREWGPRDRDFDPFADKVSQTNASLGVCSPDH
jgi:hypothetical protein